MPLNDQDKIAHLLRRAGFEARPEEIDEGASQGLEATVNKLVDFEAIPDNLAIAPAGLDDPESPRGYFNNLMNWWLNAMITTTRPLQEKMVLFWHQLFATSVDGVADPRQMYLQNENFRGNFDPTTGQVTRPDLNNPFPDGSFRRILEYLTQDPAMLYWLDNRLNNKLNNEVGTNENYAREVHELFSMGVVDAVTGEPNYTEQDIRQASRALTGWTIRRIRDSGDTFPRRFIFDSRNHDFGPYDHLGLRGGNNADFIFNNIVQHRNPGQVQSAVGRFLGMRLFRFFGYQDPQPEIINALADVFDGRNGEEPYNIRNLLRTIFTPGNLVSEAFYSDAAFKTHVKSPTELLIGSARLLAPEGLGVEQQGTITTALRNMGQELLRPPDVSGWAEGPNWINTTLALARYNFANGFMTGINERGRIRHFVDIDRILAENNLVNASPSELIDYFTRLLLQVAVSPQTQQTLIDYMNRPSGNLSGADLTNTKVRGLVHLIMTTPEYQLN